MPVTPGNEWSLRNDLRPGDIGEVIHLHGLLYSAECGWNCTLEAYVAEALADFVLKPNPRSRIWLVEHRSRVAGSIAIVEATPDSAQLRWFLVDPALRGTGVGKRLLDEALAFASREGYRSVFLWTVGGLEAARKRYDAAGFILTEEASHQRWGARVTEQRFELTFRD